MTPTELAAYCMNRDGCSGCCFAKEPEQCEECGRELDRGDDQPDLFTPPEFVMLNQDEMKRVCS